MTCHSGGPLPLCRDPEALAPACPRSSTPRPALQMLGATSSSPPGASAQQCRPCSGWASGGARCKGCCSVSTAKGCRPACPRRSWWPTCSRKRTGARQQGPEVPPPLWTPPTSPLDPAHLSLLTASGHSLPSLPSPRGQPAASRATARGAGWAERPGGEWALGSWRTVGGGAGWY